MLLPGIENRAAARVQEEAALLTTSRSRYERVRVQEVVPTFPCNVRLVRRLADARRGGAGAMGGISAEESGNEYGRKAGLGSRILQVNTWLPQSESDGVREEGRQGEEVPVNGKADGFWDQLLPCACWRF